MPTVVFRFALLFVAVWPLIAHAGGGVTDVNPNGPPAFGGRSIGLTIHPFNPNIVYVATERGGFFVSTDGGTHWRHIDNIPIPWARDILFDPQDPSVLIASGAYNGQTVNRGGIWVSNNGGSSWFKPPTSNPGCSSEASTWGIAIPNDPAAHGNVYVATDCGIAISTNSGASWTHVDPCTAATAAFCGNHATYFDVEARVVAGNVQLDVCGNEGYFRSTDGGTTWSAPDPASPARSVSGGSFNPCNVATAPGDPNTVYLANYSGVTPDGFCISRLMENTAGGAPGMWTDMQVSANNCRDPWVVTHPDLAGNPSRYQVYYGDTQRMRVQRCNLANTPRCATGAANWPTGDAGSHSDTSDIAFDPTIPNGCPKVLSSDGGIAVSTDCGATWTNSNRELHALDVLTFAGTQQGGGVVDLYAGTQDNGIYATLNNAGTWTLPVGADGYRVMADRTPPVRVFHRVCYGCSDAISNRGIVGSAGFSDPPGNMPTFPPAVQFGPRSYVFATFDNATPPNWTAWVTTNEGGAWTQLGPSPLPGGAYEVKAAGSAVAPIFYLLLDAGGTRLFRLSGPLNSTATLTPADTGLVSPSVWDVDPLNPQRLYAMDAGRNSIMFSTNGGASWTPDPKITTLVTRGGAFRFVSSFGPQVVGLAFDPNSSSILVGTLTAGIFISRNDGQDWLRVVGSEGITQAERFFFDAANDVTYAASRGRGIWRLQLSKPHIQVPGSLDWGQLCAGASSYQTLNVCNTATDDLVVDSITSSSSRFRITDPSAGYPVTISHDFCFPFQARFAPLAAGVVSGSLTIRSNDVDHPESVVSVRGEGTVGDVRVTGTTDFGVVSAWSTAEQTVKVCNSGTCALQVNGATIDCADFTLVGNPLPSSLAAGSCLDLHIAFTPLLPGRRICHLTVASADPDTPVVIRTLSAHTPPALSIHAGLANPHGTLSPTANQGSTFNLDFVYPVRPHLAWDARLGYTRLDGATGQPDTGISYVGANAKFTINPAASVRVFLNGGPGLYHFNPGSFKGGLNLGLGLNVPAGPRFAFEATYNYNWAVTGSPTLRYDQVQLGLLISF
jgi:photosystem II stability/assembly factor-like uncharacterized protein